MNVPDLNSVKPVDDFLSAHDEPEEVAEFLERGRAFLRGFSWLSIIEREFIGAAFPGIVGIFLFRISSTRPEVDPWLWVIVGDLPPAYLVCDNCKNPWEALDGYIGEMEAWISAVEAGDPIEKLIPVNSEPSVESARALKTRMRFLDERIMPMLRERLN